MSLQACSDYLQTAQTQGHKWSKMLQHERDQKLHLEEMVEQLARQHSHLEQAAHRHRPSKLIKNKDNHKMILILSDQKISLLANFWSHC
jgi:uncharacterized NAD(P)/FAD-binding protein YdhS